MVAFTMDYVGITLHIVPKMVLIRPIMNSTISEDEVMKVATENYAAMKIC
jgi:hypothetical protein